MLGTAFDSNPWLFECRYRLKPLPEGTPQASNGHINLNVAGKSCPVPKHTEKQQIPRSDGFRDPEVGRVGRTRLPVAYPRSDLTSLRYPSPPRLRITGRLTPV